MKKLKNKIKEILKVLGPGIVTGASDDDPSGIATYSQTGALFGYQQLWTALFTFPFMTIIQEICGRIGLVTGKGLAGIIKDHYSKPVLFIVVLLLCIANIINIGADLGAMASAGQLILPIPFAVLLFVITFLTLTLEIFIPYRSYAKYLKYLILSLIAYIFTAFLVKQNWSQIIYATFFPHFSFQKNYFINLVAILGTTISPYLFFWQAGEEIEEAVNHNKLEHMNEGKPQIDHHDIKAMQTDTIIGMFFSNLIMWFIIVTTASTLHLNHITSIQTADQAALALKPFAGDFAFFLFAVGIIGTGLLAVPILAGSAAYAIAETFGWKEGLYRKYHQARGFYAIISICTVLGLLVNLTPIKPFQMLYYTAVINGVCAPPLLIIIMLISRNQTIMGEHRNSIFSNIMGWSITGLMLMAALVMLVMLFH